MRCDLQLAADGITPQALSALPQLPEASRIRLTLRADALPTETLKSFVTKLPDGARFSLSLEVRS